MNNKQLYLHIWTLCLIFSVLFLSPLSAKTSTYTKLSGTPIGTTPYQGLASCDKDKAFDGDFNTFFDGATNGWVGLDFGTAKVVSLVKYAPRTGFAFRIENSLIQASNNADFSGAVTLLTITSVPSESVLTSASLFNGVAYRYIRFLTPTDACSISELEFYEGSSGLSFDADKPVIPFENSYEQTFTTWDQLKFDTMWDVAAGPVDASNVVTGPNGYLKLGWVYRRVIASKAIVTTPYIFETDFSVANVATNGGVVIRVAENADLDQIQEPGDMTTYPLQFNSEGIAFFASPDGASMTVQFSGPYLAAYMTQLTRIFVPAPAGVNLRNRGVLRIEDFGTSIYVYYNNNPYLRIDLSGKTGSIYTSGTVYDHLMNVAGVFSDREVEETGKVSVAGRMGAENNTINIYSLNLKRELKWDRRPVTTMSTQYNQILNPAMDFTTFNNQWKTVDFVLAPSDVASGFFQFELPTKRMMLSKKVYSSPNIFESDIQWNSTSSYGGLVIRIDTATAVENVQEPATGDPGFNKEGIAFYPSEDGQSMIVQFTGAPATTTPVTRISVAKPTGISNMSNRGKLRIEDYGTSVYVFYNDAPYIRIDLQNKINGIYSSGKVYTSDMQIAGTFTGMEVVETGKIAIAQHSAALQLYSALIKAECVGQKITFNNIGKKTISDAPFQLNATSTSGLPVEFILVSGPATLNGNTVSLNGTSGYVVIAANQSGDVGNCPANEVKQIIFVVDPGNTITITPSKAFSDNWVATDAIGRSLPFADQSRASRTDKYVGMFYYLWQADGIDGCPKVAPITNNTEQLADGKQNLIQNKNSYWAEPEAGYYRSTDPWVLRRNLQMLANAGVDFIFFDASNGPLYLPVVTELCKVSMQMRTEGIQTPYIAWMVNSETSARQLYDGFYAQDLYSDQWFLWNGKPLILKTDNSTFSDPILKDFFTVRHSWAWGNANESGRWDWIDNYPQNYGWTTNKNVIEQISVAKGSHPSLPNGVSFHNGVQPPYNENLLCDSTDYGLKFKEQWKQALNVDPQIVMITQWNEWISGVYGFDGGTGSFLGKTRTWYAVDEFNKEFSRDIEPMKGGYTDNYYYQMVSNIRKYKGMQTQEAASATQTITIDGTFNEWNTVSPVYKDPAGDTAHRNFLGSNNSTVYTNTTGRNDIIESRTTYDANNIYFYVKTVDPISPGTDPNWMLLFIDADRSKGTGWEGYDYVVNLGVTSASQTTLKQWTGSAWSNAVSILYKVAGNEMELSIPRSSVQMTTGTPEFYFHWADNSQQLNDISAFFTDGESAPDRRFNYNFSTSKIVTLPETTYKALTIPGTVEFEDFDNGGAGVAYADATLGNQGGAYRLNESVDIENTTGGGSDVTKTNSKEWLKYTVNVGVIGTVTASIKYSSLTGNNQATIYVDDKDKSGLINFPSTGDLQTFASKDVDLQLSFGQHVIKFFINKAADDFNLDKVVFTNKSIVYPGTGTGLNRSNWKGSAPGTWFQDSICSQVDPTIDEVWASTDSPGCSIPGSFWNVRWRGQLEPLYTETYTFYLTIKDLAKLWVNNQLLINQWSGSALGNTITATMNLTAGQKVPIQVDFAKKASDGKIKLEWSSTSNPREVIPMAQFYSATTTALEDIKNQSFEIYPNPMKDQLTINSGLTKVESIKLIDLQGRTVYLNTQNFSGSKTIDLKLLKGVYFIKLKGDAPFETQKLIIE